MTVLFKPIVIAEELRRVADAARHLLKRGHRQRLHIAAEELESWVQSSRAGPFDWTLAEPIETEASSSYQGTGSANAVYGQFTFLWRCERTDSDGVVSASKGGTDITVVRTTGKLVNEYHFDLCEGGVAPPAPGASPSPVMHCFSHAQYSAGTSFPRFPSMLLLPNDVLEMLLFELWPADWPEAIDGDRSSLLKHHRAQRKRLHRVTKAFQQLATKPFPLVSLHSRLPAPIQLF